MEAILWDGNKKLHGTLEFTDDSVEFALYDFQETSLRLSIHYSDILRVQHERLYDIGIGGTSIICKNGNRNVFVVDQPQYVISTLKQHLHL